MPRKYHNAATTGTDVINGLKALENDLNLKARLTTRLRDEMTLEIVLEVYQDINGVKIGIFRSATPWDTGDVPLLTRMMSVIHQGYWAAEALAHRSIKKG